MKSRLIMVAAAALALSANTPAGAAGPEDCSIAGNCRTIGKLEVRVDGKAADFNINQTLPWTPEGNLMLFVGESAIVRLVPAPEPGRFIPELVVGGGEAASRPLQPGELRFRFSQDAKGDTMLVVESQHDKPMHYMLVMVTPDMKPTKTSVCTLLPGKTVYEHWPHPIVQFAATNFRVREGGPACEVG